MNSVYGFKIDKQIEKSVFDKLMKLVYRETRERVNRFCKIEDKQRTLIGEILIRYITAKSCGITNRDIIFERNEYGKPFIPSIKDFHFNISHSGDWVVCAFSNQQIGIDVECVKPIEIDIGERFFSEEEYLFLSSQKEEDKRRCFFNIWTLKESYMKAVGMGFSLLSSSFSIDYRDDNISIKTTIRAEEEEENKCYFKQYYVGEDYILSVCGFDDVFCENLERVSVCEFDFLDELE